jgi:beta-glucosidase
MLMVWYPGMLGGEALADVLMGRVSPSGKLPLSVPRAASDLVPFDHHSASVRYEFEHGYRQLDRAQRAAEFPFGFGLSYTHFRYDRLTLSSEVLAPGEDLVADVSVTNVGDRTGAEVVQLYLSCPASAVLRSPKWLAGFGRLTLAPGQQKWLRMRITERELRHFDPRSQRFEVEPTSFVLRAGGSSADLPLEAGFRVQPIRVVARASEEASD